MKRVRQIPKIPARAILIALVLAGVTFFAISKAVTLFKVGGCAAGEVRAGSECLPAPPAPLAAGKTWKVIFNDEFNGRALDTRKWTPCFDWNYGACTDSFNQGREHYQASQVQISAGTARLVAEPLSPPRASKRCYTGECSYKAGLISTARPLAGNGSAYLHPFTYGYIESRMKYPAVTGMFTALWMLPTDASYNYRSEIDIAEILGGDPSIIYMTYHYNNRSTAHSLNYDQQHNGDNKVRGNDNGACAVRDYSGDWVRLGLDWAPTHIAWYIDGVKCGQFDGDTTTVPNGPMQIILNQMVDNEWQRDRNLTLPTPQTRATLEVDYVRVYQQH